MYRLLACNLERSITTRDGLIAKSKMPLGLATMPDTGSGFEVSPFLGLQELGQACVLTKLRVATGS